MVSSQILLYNQVVYAWSPFLFLVTHIFFEISVDCKKGHGNFYY